MTHRHTNFERFLLENKNFVFSQLVGAAFGAAGQRCMALSTAIFVGETKEWIPEIVEKARKLQVNAGTIH